MQYGTCNVPPTYDIELNRWMLRQRVLHKNGQLSDERIGKLDRIGLFWGRRNEPSIAQRHHCDERWETMFQKLRIFCDEHGHCMVPSTSIGEQKQLAEWVSYQRKKYKQGRLEADRTEKLNDIGLSWHAGIHTSSESILQRKWDAKLNRLQAFKSQFGHCNVPFLYKDDRELANWVNRQRTAVAQNRLHSSRREALDELGFVWKVRKLRTETGADRHAVCQQAVCKKAEPSSLPTPRKRKQNRKEEQSISSATNRRCKTCEKPKTTAIGPAIMPSVGQRVAIYWPKNDEYYPGVVLSLIHI